MTTNKPTMKKCGVEPTHFADWIESQEVYFCSNGHWVSEDGDNWIDPNTGEPPHDVAFATSVIEFRGGPRDGEMVG